MYKIEKSSLFEAHALAFVSDYRESAGTVVAKNFATGVDQGIQFIARNPLACQVYTQVGGHEYRKWPVKNFPHSLYFRIHNDVIILEAIYAHRMDTVNRFHSEIQIGEE